MPVVPECCHASGAMWPLGTPLPRPNRDQFRKICLHETYGVSSPTNVTLKTVVQQREGQGAQGLPGILVVYSDHQQLNIVAQQRQKHNQFIQCAYPGSKHKRIQNHVSYRLSVRLKLTSCPVWGRASRGALSMVWRTSGVKSRNTNNILTSCLTKPPTRCQRRPELNDNLVCCHVLNVIFQEIKDFERQKFIERLSLLILSFRSHWQKVILIRNCFNDVLIGKVRVCWKISRFSTSLKDQPQLIILNWHILHTWILYSQDVFLSEWQGYYFVFILIEETTPFSWSSISCGFI